MKTIFKTNGPSISFVLADVEPEYQEIVEGLYYLPCEVGFAKTFPADTPNIDGIYRNFEQYAREMVLQAAQVQPTEWERALSAFLEIVQGTCISWWLVGSAALAVRGLDVPPRDIDLVVDDADALRLGELLMNYLVEPIQPSPGWIWNWFGRAFLHARLEWIGGVNSGADRPLVSDYGPTAANRLEVTSWRGYEIQVPPLDLQYEVCLRRGLVERATIVAEHLSNR